MAGPGPRKWLLVEQTRLPALRQALGNSVRLRVVESRNNKFALTVTDARSASPTEERALPATGGGRRPEQTIEAPQPAQPAPGPFGAPP